MVKYPEWGLLDEKVYQILNTGHIINDGKPKEILEPFVAENNVTCAVHRWAKERDLAKHIKWTAIIDKANYGRKISKKIGLRAYFGSFNNDKIASSTLYDLYDERGVRKYDLCIGVMRGYLDCKSIRTAMVLASQVCFLVSMKGLFLPDNTTFLSVNKPDVYTFANNGYLDFYCWLVWPPRRG